MKRKYKTDQIDIEKFKEQFPLKPNWQIAAIFNVGKSTVNKLKRQYNLKKTHAEQGRFKKGQT